MKVGLALSGGGMRGIAHIGVLKALEENQLKPDIISGASSGAIIGTLYAAGYDADEIFEYAKEKSLLSLMSAKLSAKGLTSLDGMVKLLRDSIVDDSFEALNIPLYVSITDLNEGGNILLSSGKLFEAVKASCSIPVLFKPVEINQHACMDGGIMNNLPAGILKDKSDITIGVNLISNPILNNSNLSNIFKIAMRTFELTVYKNSQESLHLCDIKISPNQLSKISIFRISDTESIYNIGYEAALSAIEEFKKSKLST